MAWPRSFRFQAVDSSTNWCNLTDYLNLLRHGRDLRAEKGFRPEAFDPRITSYYSSDASPSYIIFPAVPRLMGHMLPATRFIAMLRDPVSRAWSGYLQSLTSYGRNGDKNDLVSFGEAVELEIGIIEQCEDLFPDPRRRYTDCIWPFFTAEVLEDTLRSGASSPFVGKAGFELAAGRCTAGMLRKHSLVIRGLYYFQIKMWLDEVGRNRLHVVYSESYFADPEVRHFFPDNFFWAIAFVSFSTQKKTPCCIRTTSEQSPCLILYLVPTLLRC